MKGFLKRFSIRAKRDRIVIIYNLESADGDMDAFSRTSKGFDLARISLILTGDLAFEKGAPGTSKGVHTRARHLLSGCAENAKDFAGMPGKYVRSSEPKSWYDRARTSRAMTLANAQT